MWQPGRSFLHLDWHSCSRTMVVWVLSLGVPWTQFFPSLKWHSSTACSRGGKKQIKLSRMENRYYNILVTRAASRSSETEDHLDATFTQIFPSLNETACSCLGVLGHGRVILYLKGMNVTWKLECVVCVLVGFLTSYTLFSCLIYMFKEKIRHDRNPFSPAILGFGCVKKYIKIRMLVTRTISCTISNNYSKAYSSHCC